MTIKYASKMEEALHRLYPGLLYEPASVEYTQRKTYTPDFMMPGLFMFFEFKGRFRNMGEARIYKDVRKDNKQCEIVFIFNDPDTHMPFAQKRKDGTKQTMGEWADRNRFRYTTVGGLGDFIDTAFKEL